MTTTLTVNRQCSRCPRVEQTEVRPEDIVAAAKAGKNTLTDGPVALTVSVAEKKLIEFAFLCVPCRQIVARYIDHIGKKPDKQSALRTHTKVEVEED